MEPVVWTRDDLAAVVAGAHVTARDRQGRYCAPRGWLVELAVEWKSDSDLDRNGAVDAATAVLPSDRAVLFEHWRRTLDRPGELVEYEVRGSIDGQLSWLRTRAVNLLHQPEIGSVVIAVDVIGAAEGGLPEAEDADEDYEAPAWVQLTLDVHSLITEVEGQPEAIFGVPAAEVIGRLAAELLHPQTAPSALRLWVEMLESPGGTRTGRQRILRADDVEQWIDLTMMHRVDPDGGAPTFRLLCCDITGRRAQEQELHRSREEFRLLADQIPATVFRATPTGRVVFGNARWQAQRAIEAGAPDHLRSVVHRDDWEGLAEALRAAADDDGSHSCAVEVRNDDGSAVLAVHFQSVGDPGDGPRALIGTILDATATAELRRRVHEDEVTGLLSRFGIERELADAVADGNGAGTLVLFLDLDDFKRVNDDHGHDVGDLVLREVGQRLAGSLRPSDAVGRYGGDEFVVVCRDVRGAKAAAIITDRITAALDDPVMWSVGSWLPRASIGVARPEPGEPIGALLRRADLAMYEVKRLRPSRSGRADEADPR